MDAHDAIQSISFRLADSVPDSLLERWQWEFRLGKQTIREKQALLQRIAQFEDQGYGACHLRDPRVAGMVQSNLHHFDGVRYDLIERCVMPNHVHVLIRQHPGVALARLVGSWKSYAAKRANAILGRQGRLWMTDYFDRFIRSEEHFAQASHYIRNNPVVAGLCGRQQDWAWSSANPRAWPSGVRGGWAV